MASRIDIPQDSQWRTRAHEVHHALAVAKATKALAQKIQGLIDDEGENFIKWGKNWEHQADLEIKSFEFFVSCNGNVPSGHRFAANINHPAFLLKEIIRTMKLFEIDVEPLYIVPEPVEETVQLALL